jgi:hypothetical protein
MKTTKARKYNSKILEKIFADIPKSLEKQVNSTMIIAALMDDEMKRKNFTIGDMAKLFKVKSETIENWLGGTFDFKISLLSKIEEKLDIKLFNITPCVKDQNLVINELSHDHGIKSPEFTTKILERYVKMGYISRMDGSITASSGLTCNCCAKRTPSLIILEHDYPNNPDVGLCGECYTEYSKLVQNHE